MVLNAVENDFLNQVDGNFTIFIYDSLIDYKHFLRINILDSLKKNQNICVCYMYLHLNNFVGVQLKHCAYNKIMEITNTSIYMTDFFHLQISFKSSLLLVHI